jgi:hypothetical protein
MRESAGCAPARSTIIGEPEAAPIPFRRGRKDDGRSSANTGPMLSSLRCGAKTRSGKPCGSPAVSGGKRCRMRLWCAGIRGSARQPECAEARPLYARSHRGTSATAGADAAIADADSRHRLIASVQVPGAEGRLHCAVVSIVARGLTSGRKRRGPSSSNRHWLAASCRKRVRLALTGSARELHAKLPA